MLRGCFSWADKSLSFLLIALSSLLFTRLPISILSISILAVGLGISLCIFAFLCPPPRSILVLMPLESDLPAVSGAALLTSLDFVSRVASDCPIEVLLPAGLVSGEDCSFLGEAKVGATKGDRTGDVFSGAWKDTHHFHTSKAKCAVLAM